MAAGRESAALRAPAADKQRCCRQNAFERGVFWRFGEFLTFGVANFLMRLKAGAVGATLG
jgi:hypothetical protein